MCIVSCSSLYLCVLFWFYCCLFISHLFLRTAESSKSAPKRSSGKQEAENGNRDGNNKGFGEDLWKSLMAQGKSGGGGGGPSSRPPIDDKNRQQLMFSIAVTIGGAIAAAYVLMGGSAVEITYKDFINDYLSARQV